MANNSLTSFGLSEFITNQTLSRCEKERGLKGYVCGCILLTVLLG